MDSLAPIKLEQEVAAWNYDDSVRSITPKLASWHMLTKDIVRQLYIARRHLKEFASSPDREGKEHRTWTDYCSQIGITRQTANRWLACFTPAELSATGQDEFLLESPRSSAEDARLASLRRVAEFRETGIRPDGWSPEDEILLKRQLGESKAIETAASYVSLMQFKPRYTPRKDYFAEILADMRDTQSQPLASVAARRQQSQAYEMVSEYLFGFKDMNEKVKAAVNLSFKLRQVINDCLEELNQITPEVSVEDD